MFTFAFERCFREGELCHLQVCTILDFINLVHSLCVFRDQRLHLASPAEELQCIQLTFLFIFLPNIKSYTLTLLR